MTTKKTLVMTTMTTMKFMTIMTVTMISKKLVTMTMMPLMPKTLLSADPDSSINILPSLVERRQLQLYSLVMPATLVDEFDRDIAQLIHVGYVLVPL